MGRKPQKNDSLPASLDMLILRTLAKRNLHGYGIVQFIQQSSDNEILIEEGSLYPALQRLELNGWIEGSWGLTPNNRRARIYKITPAVNSSGLKPANTRNSRWRSRASWERSKRDVASALSVLDKEHAVQRFTARGNGASPCRKNCRTRARGDDPRMRSGGSAAAIRESGPQAGGVAGDLDDTGFLGTGAGCPLRLSHHLANKAFSALAVLLLAQGIGANTAIYSFMESILLRSLPVGDPESLVVLSWHSRPPFNGSRQWVHVMHGPQGLLWPGSKGAMVSGIFPYSAFETLR